MGVTAGVPVARMSGGPPAAPVADAAEIEAFFHEFFRPLVRRAVRRHRLSTEDACDVVQEAFVVALTKMGPEGNAAAWLKQVVDFLAINLNRTRLRRAELLRYWVASSSTTQRSMSLGMEDD